MTAGSKQFNGFESAHFDAYEKRKWSSNRFNLERMAVREQAEAIMAQGIDSLGAAATNLAAQSTQDHPTIFNGKCVDSQWVFLARPGVEFKRISPLLKHMRAGHSGADDHSIQHLELALSLCVNQSAVGIALHLHTNAHLDRRNLLQRLESSTLQTEFLSLLSALPNALKVRIGEQEPVAASECTTEQLSAWIQALENVCDLDIKTEFQRDDVLVSGDEFVSVTSSLLQALLPLYHFIAWTAENDHVGGEGHLHEREQRNQTSEEGPSTNQSSPAASNPAPRDNTWSYRPQWSPKDESPGSEAPQVLTPSARARMRKEETQRTERELRAKAQEATAKESANRPPRRPAPSRAPQPKGPRPEREPRLQPRSPQHKNKRSNHEQARPKRSTGGGPHQKRQPPGKKAVKYVDCPGEANTLDYVRVSGGLLNGKVGKVVDITSKGNYKIDIGDMVFEVAKDTVTRVNAE